MKIFKHYSDKNSSHFDLSKEEKFKIFNKLKHFDSSSILKEDNILSENMLGFNLVNSYMPHMLETKSGSFFTPLEIFKKEVKKGIKLGDFRPTVAKYIYDNYSGDGDVLDFSSGYGSRLMGALISDKVKKYLGYDPCTKTFEAYNNILKDAVEFKQIKEISLENQPFENAILPFNHFDLTFSSPPYFNAEIYSDETTQSCNKYPIKGLWKLKFLKVLIEKCFKSLKPNGHFIINVANVRDYTDLEEDTMDMALSAGFKHIKTYQMKLSALTQKDFKYEPIFVFQKPCV